MAKEYKDATPAEKYKSAMDKEKSDKKDYSVTDTLRKLIMPKETATPVPPTPAPGLKKGGKAGCSCHKMAKGGKVSSASSRADGCAQRGKTKGRMV